MNTYVFKDDVITNTPAPVMPAEGARALKVADIQTAKSIHGWDTVIITFDYKGYQFSQTFANCDNDCKCSQEKAMLKSLALDNEIRVGDTVVALIAHKWSSKHELNWPVVLDVDAVIR